MSGEAGLGTRKSRKWYFIAGRAEHNKTTSMTGLRKQAQGRRWTRRDQGTRDLEDKSKNINRRPGTEWKHRTGTGTESKTTPDRGQEKTDIQIIKGHNRGTPTGGMKHGSHRGTRSGNRRNEVTEIRQTTGGPRKPQWI